MSCMRDFDFYILLRRGNLQGVVGSIGVQRRTITSRLLEIYSRKVMKLLLVLQFLRREIGVE